MVQQWHLYRASLAELRPYAAPDGSEGPGVSFEGDTASLWAAMLRAEDRVPLTHEAEILRLLALLLRGRPLPRAFSWRLVPVLAPVPGLGPGATVFGVELAGEPLLFASEPVDWLADHEVV